ncbi:MAG TPA: protease pro-enzyme activation domain-containing protein [Terracidiphilus sp.]|nr:protease pro-enzyme activation domain-containing protein [Terracidiphilus sp.]
MIRSLRSFAFSVAAMLLLAVVAGQAQSVLTHHVRDSVRSGRAQFTGRLPVSQELQLDLVLPLRDPQGLKSFLADIYNPSSPNYRQFLTVSQFTARFGPTQDQYDAVLRFASTYGLTVVGGSRDSMDVQVKGSVGTIETAFHVNLRTYQHPNESREFYGIDSEPSVDLPFNLWHISGLDNYSIPHPMLVSRTEYAAAHGIDADKVVAHATTGSGPSASFLGSDMRAAYYGSGSLTGAGQNLGLFEYLGTDLADLTTYYKNVGQTNNVPVSVISTDGTTTSCVDSRAGGSCDDTEQTLDMTQALGMAPGLASLVMYVGSTDTAIIGAMTSHSPLPTTIGCSWGWTPSDPTTLDPYFEKMAAQGQNFFAASGDDSTWKATGNAAAWPADDANVVSVGGTDLTTSKAAGPWASETAWADSGGGISPDKIAIPAWQQLSGVINSSNKGSTTLRNGPDVSANANFTFYTCADQTTCLANEYGGTSFAAPMWAGYIALVNQQLASNGKSTIGFLNPTIYAQNVNAGTYAADFHDITSGTSGSYSAVTGFDLVTGWGSPNSGLLAALTGSGTTSPSYSLSASPASITVTQGGSGSSTITVAVSGGFDSSVALSASGLPTGVTAGFSPASITGAGTSTLSFTVASSTATGTYTITVSGTSGSTVETTTVALTVTGTTPAFSISASPSTITIARSSSGEVTVSTTVSGGFNSAVALSATGEGNQNSVSFNPSSITGAGSSTMTITVGRRASLGSHTVTVTGKSGTTSHTATVTFTVIQ